MNKVFSIVLLFVSITSTSFAQLSKMQFQDAEEQYSAGKFKETLELLDASEKSAGKNNPLIEHLRILTLTELLKQDLNGYIDQLEFTRKAAMSFLTKYDGDSRLEDKYREVYQASKILASFPSKAEKAEKEKIEGEKKILAGISFLPGYEDGMTVEELKAKARGFQGEATQDTLKMLAFLNDKLTSVMISPRSGLSYGYTTSVANTTNDFEFTEAKARFKSQVAAITAKLGAEPIWNKPSKPETVELPQAGVIIKTVVSTESCAWKRGPISITLHFHGISSEKFTGGSIILTSVNTTFK